MKVIFLTPYPLGCAPSQRFRFEQYLSLLTDNGIQYEVSSFWDNETWELLYEPNHRIKKIRGLIKGFVRRSRVVFHVGKVDFVFIHRELTPLGPPIFEWIIAKLFKRKIIYDFDDAIWISQVSNTPVFDWLKNSSKTATICELSKKVNVGNKYLGEFAAAYCRNIQVIPTTIDTINVHNKTKNQFTDEVTIGWTGSHSTLPYLEEILPVIRKLETIYDFKFLVIANQKPDFNLRCLKFIKWNKNTEVKDLLKLNIGLMPLPDNHWTRGKCGLKALQYLSLGIPALVSPVGVNSQIVKSEYNGYSCKIYEDWYTNIERLITNPTLRKTLGENGRKTIESDYSVKSNSSTFLDLFS